MAIYYLESSALVKLYIHEPGTQRLLALAASDAGHRFSMLFLAPVEFRAAVRRRQRNKDIAARAADALLESFREHAEGRFLIQPFSDALTDVASALIDGYGLRGYDAMQLAGYILLRSVSVMDEPIFVCADKALLSAARNEGCAVMDPSLP